MRRREIDGDPYQDSTTCPRQAPLEHSPKKWEEDKNKKSEREPQQRGQEDRQGKDRSPKFCWLSHLQLCLFRQTYRKARNGAWRTITLIKTRRGEAMAGEERFVRNRKGNIRQDLGQFFDEVVTQQPQVDGGIVEVTQPTENQKLRDTNVRNLLGALLM